MQGRKFTWSNRRDQPTLERLDRILISPEWLRSLSSDCSNHSPLLLQTDVVPWAKSRFKFEAFWPKIPGFFKAVELGWLASLIHADPFRNLDFKLRNVAKTLKAWSIRYVGSVRLQLAVAREVILRFDVAEESRTLSPEEIQLRNELKIKCLGLSSLARTIARQRSCLVQGDANTNFFHLQACHRG